MLKLKLQYLATWFEERIHLKRPWCWERLKAGGEGDNRGWDVWMASLTQWTWVWVNSVSWWWTGRPGVLQSVGSQRVGHDWVTELNRDSDIENRLVDTVREGESGTNWESSIETYTLPYVEQLMGNCIIQGVLWQHTGVGCGSGWEGGSRTGRHMYTYGWFMLLYGRNQHNIVKQLSSN